MVGVDSIFGAASARKLHTGRKILGERDVVFSKVSRLPGFLLSFLFSLDSGKVTRYTCPGNFFLSRIYIYSFYSGNGIDLKMVGVHLEYYYELKNFLIAKLLSLTSKIHKSITISLKSYLSLLHESHLQFKNNRLPFKYCEKITVDFLPD